MSASTSATGWSHGYNVSAGYTYGFYRELTPDWLNFGALLHGYGVPDTTRAFRYLELGCGQGFGLCLLAAVYPHAEFIGVDFNPEHIAHARELAQAAGLGNVRFEEADFSALAAHWPADFGRFDYVVLHGIYSWVPLPLRQMLVRNLDAAALPGGLVYVSYNSQPGWTSALPLQHLLRKLQRGSSRTGPQIIRQGAELFDALIAADAGVVQALPPLRSRVEALKSQNPAYLVQEYLHDEWHPLWFSQVEDELAGAKLRYIGSATLPENYLPGLLPPAQAEIVRRHDGSTLQQELIDLLINQSFRRDLYCRGPRSLRGSMQQLSAYRLQAGALPTVDGALEIQTSFGTLTIRKEVAAAVFEMLARQAASIAELAALPVFSGKPLAEPIQVATLLLHAGYVSLQRPAGDNARIAAFNRTIADAVVDGFMPYAYLAARDVPTAIAVNELQMALYRLLVDEPQADSDAARLATRLLDVLLASGRTILRDGKVLESPNERFERIAELTAEFVETVLPVWRRFGVV